MRVSVVQSTGRCPGSAVQRLLHTRVSWPAAPGERHAPRGRCLSAGLALTLCEASGG